MEKNALNVLVIDDDPVIRNLMRSILSSKVNALVADKPSSALNILNNHPVDIVISDYKLPEMNGIELLKIIKEDHPDIEMIMISSDTNMDAIINAMRLGVADFFKKPFTTHDIWLSIERTSKYAALKANLEKEIHHTRHLQTQLGNELGSTIIGKSDLINEVRMQMEMVAQTPDTSVLILGESGTGKELVARGIHNMSKRNNALFGAVNMSAIPESLFESEFFGHKKGSFTGALSDKAGWFESTHGGTLFFDEIGEMSLGLQVKLLRVLEDRQFIKVGSQRPQSFDVRVISATNKSVEELSDGKNFRLDLFHRLGTFIITLPPLRERKEDIALLASHFTEKIGQKLGKKNIMISAQAMKALNNYSFPGNIRELKNLTERALILCNGNELLPNHFGLSHHPEINKNIAHDPDIFDLNEIERSTIIRALQKTDYNKAEASRLVNLEWNALYRRIKKHSIEMPD